MNKCRAEIEWLAEDTFVSVGCLRIGFDGDFSHLQFDEFARAATVYVENYGQPEAVIEVKGWDNPQHYSHGLLRLLAWILQCLGLINDKGITPEQWQSMELCFLREGIKRYRMSRARGPRWKKQLHWCRRRFDAKAQKWIKDAAL